MTVSCFAVERWARASGAVAVGAVLLGLSCLPALAQNTLRDELLGKSSPPSTAPYDPPRPLNPAPPPEEARPPLPPLAPQPPRPAQPVAPWPPSTETK